MGLGDEENDLEMVEFGGWGVGMGKGIDGVKGV
ncbi:HAD hydrolase family protein [Bacillus altitudinis]|nr:HAD hydrolase family protein [Bacillus altitudinis]